MLLGLQNVTFEFGARTIVEDATWHPPSPKHPTKRKTVPKNKPWHRILKFTGTSP